MVAVFFVALLDGHRSGGVRAPLGIGLCERRKRRDEFTRHFGGRESMSFIFYSACRSIVYSSSLIISTIAETARGFTSSSYFGPKIAMVPVYALNFRGYSLFFSRMFASRVRRVENFGCFGRFGSIRGITSILSKEIPKHVGSGRHVLICGCKVNVRSLCFTRRFCHTVRNASVRCGFYGRGCFV